MKLVARMALKDGMIIGEDVYSYQNVLLIKEGTQVDRQVINKLARYSIMCVSIKETANENQINPKDFEQSASFQQFESAYIRNLEIFKRLLGDFFAGKIPMRTSFLLEIHTDIMNSVKDVAQPFCMLPHLLIKEEDFFYSHCLNGALISNALGTWLALEEDDLKTLILCGFLYDIGKLSLPDSLMQKKEPLNKFEYNWLKIHVYAGYDLLKKENLNASIINSTLYHHERCDGSGYPDQLREAEIDRFSKYIAIVDDYLEMTSLKNSSASPKTVAKAIRCFENHTKRYDKKALSVFLEELKKIP